MTTKLTCHSLQVVADMLARRELCFEVYMIGSDLNTASPIETESWFPTMKWPMKWCNSPVDQCLFGLLRDSGVTFHTLTQNFPELSHAHKSLKWSGVEAVHRVGRNAGKAATEADLSLIAWVSQGHWCSWCIISYQAIDYISHYQRLWPTEIARQPWVY